MRWRVTALISVMVAMNFVARPCAQAATEGDDSRMKSAVARVEARLKELNARQPTVIPIGDEAVIKSLPGVRVVSVRFRMYPVAMLAPEPLKSQNLFFVPEKGVPNVVNSVDALQSAFKEHAVRARAEQAQRQMVRAWLVLTQELIQDGFYKFSPVELEIAHGPDEDELAGKFRVVAGGKGEVSAMVILDRQFRVMAVEQKSTVKPGVRPICQATKLLDRDPIVRRMAEQDILVMGRAAKPYLDQQRAKARPELKRAIDRVWQRIVNEGW